MWTIEALAEKTHASGKRTDACLGVFGLSVLLFFFVSFLASIAGAICGIGGGVIIKPVLDMLHLESVSTINFLSGCTVLSMSLYSVGKSLLSQEKMVDTATGTPLAIGAAAGGVAGKQLFSAVSGWFRDTSMVGGVQAACLGVITAGTLAFTLQKHRIHTKTVRGAAACAVIGLLLGIMSSFLGIGGGPINLVVLNYFFSMDSKTAAANSLYIILFSQAASLLATILSGSVPGFQPAALFLMVAGGIGGGIAGRKLNRRMDNQAVDKLFIGLMVVIVAICVYNSVRAFQG